MDSKDISDDVLNLFNSEYFDDRIDACKVTGVFNYFDSDIDIVKDLSENYYENMVDDVNYDESKDEQDLLDLWTMVHGLSEENFYKLATNRDDCVRRMVCELGGSRFDYKYLDLFLYDDVSIIRGDVAVFGRDKDLDILVNDHDPCVRERVARVGRDKDLDILVRDDDENVLREVVKQCRDCDYEWLIAHSVSEVRSEIAKNCSDMYLDVLVDDNDYNVRVEVARRGRDKDLDVLVHDNNPDVLMAVLDNCRECDCDVLTNNDDIRISEEARRKKLDIVRSRLKSAVQTENTMESVCNYNSQFE